MFKKIGAIVKTSYQFQKSNNQLTAIGVRQIAKNCLAHEFKDFDEDVTKTIKVASYKNGVLTIIGSSPVLSDLHMRSEKLKECINEKAGKNIIRSFRFRVG